MAAVLALMSLGDCMSGGVQEGDWPGGGRARELAGEKLPPPFEVLKPLHAPMGRPKRGDWLAEREETGQSLAEYKECDPIRPGRKYKVIYIQPVGEFTKDQERVLGLVREYMSLFYMIPAEVKPGLTLDRVPQEARRRHMGNDQKVLREGKGHGGGGLLQEVAGDFAQGRQG